MITVRPVAPADAAQWAGLRHALWPEGSPETHLQEIRAFFSAPSSSAFLPAAVFVSVDPGGDRVTGFAEVSRRPYAEGCDTSPVAYLEGWYVVPDCRRHGVGAPVEFPPPD